MPQDLAEGAGGRTNRLVLSMVKSYSYYVPNRLRERKVRMFGDDDEEEVLGEPTFELRLRDGKPQVSGCYFMYPVLQVDRAVWDEGRPDRILVTADDGSRWFADNVGRHGVTNVKLHPLDA
jgi:hypothetical protein